MGLDSQGPSGAKPGTTKSSSRTMSGTRVVESLGTDEVHADRTTAHDSALIHRVTPVTKKSWQAPALTHQKMPAALFVD